MTDAWRTYTGEIYKNLDYRATWRPDAPMALGDVGRLTRDRYEYVTSLESLGVKFTSRASEATSPFRYMTSGAVKFGGGAGAEMPAEASGALDAKVELTIGFNRSSAVAFLAKESRVEAIENLDRIEKELLRRMRFDEWDKSYVVVTEVVCADSTTVLLAGESGGSVVLGGGANLAGGSLELIDADVSLVRAENMAIQIVSAGGLVPLFRVHGIRKGLFRKGRFVRRSGEQPGADDASEHEGLGEIPFGLDD